MNVRAVYPVVLICAALCGCNNTPQSQERVREDTARTTAALKSDIQGAAQGIRDGLREPTASSDSSKLVDINTAGRDRLESLPGLDGAAADRIIAHRPYSHAADLTKRNVLTRGEYDRIASRVTAGH
jgi:DNA uptake protein ComE-like DNA-binding protein